MKEEHPPAITNSWIRSLTRRVCRRPFKKPTKRVAVLIPLTADPSFGPDEETSLRHWQKYLSGYDTYFVAPQGCGVQRDGIETKYFPRRFFGSVARHNQLLWSPGFYRAFEDYEYIFFYHLDALVFRDELEKWCDEGYDFIGPPWIVTEQTPWVKEPGVGNGGFALFNVRNKLEVLYRIYEHDPLRYWMRYVTMFPKLAWAPMFCCRALYKLGLRIKLLEGIIFEWKATLFKSSSWGRSPDVFFGTRAKRYDERWNPAPWDLALKFAFEADPPRCSELAGGHMPFGCHAWARYDRAFWEPHLIGPDNK